MNASPDIARILLGAIALLCLLGAGRGNSSFRFPERRTRDILFGKRKR